jgi:predicted nucleotidyltransferase
MGMADALFSQTQQRVLGLLFGQPDRRFGTVELIKLAGSGSGAVQRELERLSTSGLVVSTVSGRQRWYQANRASPVFDDLYGLVEKMTGIPEVVRGALSAIESKISYAILYGSVAKHLDNAASDIDVLVVSDEVHLEELYETLQAAEARLGRRVSPTLYTSAEYRKRRKAKHPFLAKVMAGKKLILIGSEDAVGPPR